MAKNTSEYQKLSTHLKAILEWFESGDVTVEEALKKYEEANKLIVEMEKYLKGAENKIQKIRADFQ